LESKTLIIIYKNFNLKNIYKELDKIIRIKLNKLIQNYKI